MKITDIIKNNTVKYESFRQGFFYYTIDFQGETFQFTIPLDDIGTATMPKEDKAIYYMRWIKPALTENTFVKVG